MSSGAKLVARCICVSCTRLCYYSRLKACPHWQLDRDPIAIQPQRCPHLQLDRDRIAIRPIHIARWIRSRSDRDRLNPIRRSGRYLHVRYACSRNIQHSSLVFVLAHLTSLYQRFLQAKKPHLHIGHQSRDTEMRRRYRFQSAVWTLAIPIGSRSDRDPFWSSVDRP